MENGLTDTNTPPIKVTYDFSKYEETFGDTSFRAFQGVPEMRDTTCCDTKAWRNVTRVKINET